MDTHTAASALGAFLSSYISGLEARYFLPCLFLGNCWVTYTLVKTLQNTVTGKDIKHILKNKLKDLTKIFWVVKQFFKI